MPEGPVLHRFARQQNRDLAGRRVRASAAQARFAPQARRLNGRVFQRAEARGKHLFHHWSGGAIVHVHLGMFGDFYRFLSPAPAPRPTVRLRLSTAQSTWDLIGPPTCELISQVEHRVILDRLGPDPISSRGGESLFVERLRRTDRAIGHALMDQRVVAGVGNIYRAEILFLTGIHPLRPSSSLSVPELEGLWAVTKGLLRRGVREERIWTIEPEERPLTRPGRRRFYVYQQETCLRCGSPIARLHLTGRTMFACPRCQRRSARARRGSAASGSAGRQERGTIPTL
ncbi:MAG TPA: DNA-formamidopyrimidine glycosylase family protein [Thermoanaerobaculia bacterium]|nr:DNA-formamidopyrimidine glycosylase family protein [Thermoanaerobaculia bacterium]